MRERLSVLTRLAFGRLCARDGKPAPVILDDALVYSDDDRIERMFDALHRQAREQQIIVFSCRQRAFQRLGGNVLQMTERSEEQTSELQSLMRISYAVFCLKKKIKKILKTEVARYRRETKYETQIIRP